MKQFGILFGVAAMLVMSACAPVTAPAAEEPAAQTEAATQAPAAENAPDLSGIKSFLLEHLTTLHENAAQVQAASSQYYDLAEAAGFDYAALWAEHQDEVLSTIQDARTAWMAASPGYEQVEGIVAGVPSLADYDVILDAGASGEEDPENAVPFDLTLPDGRVLPKPGNLFGVTESALWGTEPDYRAPDVEADFDGSGQIDFGEALPDANVLKAGADALESYIAELQTKAEAWEPTEADAFTALVVMTPTMSEYFDSWKNSRFVAGDASTQRDFVAISRLADIQDILGGLEVVYAGVQPRVASVDAAMADQIAADYASLIAFVADVYADEQSGHRYTPEDADLLGKEAQDRATAITGQLTQIAAQLGVQLEAYAPYAPVMRHVQFVES